MYLYYGIKYDGEKWNIATSMMSSRKVIINCIDVYKKMDPKSKWAIGCSKKSEIEGYK